APAGPRRVALRGAGGRTGPARGADPRGDGVGHGPRRAAQGGHQDRSRLGTSVRRFLLVGLTGSIATGKSTVSQMFAHLGARVIDADLLAREVVVPGQPAYAKIVEEFGPSVVQEDGDLDRKALGAVVFADPAKRKRLEEITHPAIRVRQQRILSVLEEEDHEGIVIWDVALLFESAACLGWIAWSWSTPIPRPS